MVRSHYDGEDIHTYMYMAQSARESYKYIHMLKDYNWNVYKSKCKKNEMHL